MPSKGVVLWRLCDWYLNKRQFSLAPEHLFEVFRAVTKSIAYPSVEMHHIGSDYIYEPLTPAQEQIASMYRHMVGLVGKSAVDWRFDWAWEGHKVEFPKLFDEDRIKDDEKLKKAKAKWLAKKVKDVPQSS